MDRRDFISSISSAGVLGLAGCSSVPFGTENNNSGRSKKDSDLDGVVDKKDYAPWDENVQNKSDVLDDCQVEPLSPDDDDVDSNPAKSLFGRGTAPTVQPAPSFNGETIVSSMSAFIDYTGRSATFRVRPNSISQQPFRVLVVARKFPRRDVVAYTHSGTLNPETTADLTVEFDSAVPTNASLYYTGFVTPDRPLSELTVSELKRFHETNPFERTSEGIVAIETDNSLEDVYGNSYGRTAVEGGYVVSLQGTTLGDDWSILYFISQSAYEMMRMSPRGRSRSEYVNYAISTGSGRQFIEMLLTASRQAGLTQTSEQTQFVIDVVQSIPDVQESIGTGYDGYTKFIEETMTEIHGDSEDLAVTLAVLLDELGHETVLIEFPSHIGVGIAGDYSGTHISYKNTRYYFVESTEQGWGIGEVPDSLDASQVTIKKI